MASFSRSSTLTPCRSPTPTMGIPVQPDHFYGSDGVQVPPSPNSIGKTWLDPVDDPQAARGIPVFKPSMAEFRDFESYMKRIECWGQRSGIVKVIPPKEWSNSLPDMKPQMVDLKIHSPIEQNMFGSGGLFRQENIEKRKNMSIREWAELCSKEDFRAPGVQEVGLTARSANTAPRPKIQRKGKGKAGTVVADGVCEAGPSNYVVKEEPVEDNSPLSDRPPVVTPPSTELTPPPAKAAPSKKKGKAAKKVKEETPKAKPKRAAITRAVRTARETEKSVQDNQFLETFDPHSDWLPPNTKPDDYNAEFCQVLERRYWRNCGLGKPAWYGADTQGSLFTDDTTSWNVAHLPSTLSRLLPSSEKGLPGVNTPYLYFGMWRATFAWHVEDMDLFSINYIHFGAPKFWYSVPQEKATSLERAMRGYFPKDTSKCPQFLRHKSFLASPSLLANSSCRPNRLVQKSGEFVITYPRGYHAGFNLGFNCAESVNFALDSWIELGRSAKACECIGDSVRIDVDQLLRDRADEDGLSYEESIDPPKASSSKKLSKKEIVKQELLEDSLSLTKTASRKRKSEPSSDAPKAKKAKTKSKPTLSIPTITITPPRPKLSITLRIPPKPAEPEPFPCCLCVSMSKEGLLRVADPPIKRKDAIEAAGNPKVWMAHEFCANVVPETWIDELDSPDVGKERVILGVDGIVKDRWNLKCSACTKSKPKAHGAPVQCTKGKCSKAFHVNCAREGHQQQIVFSYTEVEKEVVLVDTNPTRTLTDSHQPVESDGGPYSAGHNMAVDPQPANDSAANDSSNILKTIKKYEVEILCTQHNPAVAARKKANKQDKIRNDLLALPSMSRIKIRVSSGVFEVSLIRVMEETGSVEVIWDQGMPKEFKWGSVVFGSTDGPVLQKPAERAPEQPSTSLPVNTFPSVTAATGYTSYVSPYPGNVTSTTPAVPAKQEGAKDSTTPVASTSTKYAYPSRPAAYDYWNYASQYAAAAGYPYAYGGYYANPIPGGTQAYAHPYVQSYAQTSYRQGQLQWQQPYQGPSQHGQGLATATSGSTSENPPTNAQNTTNKSYYRDRPTIIVPPMSKVSSAAASSSSSSQANTPSLHTPPVQPETEATAGRESSSSDTTPVMNTFDPVQQQQSSDPPTPSTMASLQQISSLASMPPSEIVTMLNNDPSLMAAVLAAISQNQDKDPSTNT